MDRMAARRVRVLMVLGGFGRGGLDEEEGFLEGIWVDFQRSVKAEPYSSDVENERGGKGISLIENCTASDFLMLLQR
jgi:hypothetical protein